MAMPAQKLNDLNDDSVNTSTQPRRLRKGDILFHEGDNSFSMYHLRSGMIRIFKKKGDASIEIETIRAGQVVGELAFLDGNPRSASGEAISDCELVEISGPAFKTIMKDLPDWFKTLLKTVVGRLRTASNRIRQLESASSAVDYSAKDGSRTANYVFLGPYDILKVASAILLVHSRHGTVNADKTGVEIRISLLHRYAYQIMGIPLAKITALLDVLNQMNVVTLGDTISSNTITVKDPDFIEQFIAYVNEENLLEPSKRHDITLKGFQIMALIAKNISKYPKNSVTGLTSVNIAEIRSTELGPTGKEQFRMEEFPELVKLSYCSTVAIISNQEMNTEIKEDSFLQAFRYQRLLIAVNLLNQQKRKAASGGK